MSYLDRGSVIDLHTHSDRSDGSEPPDVVVAQAARAGLDVVGLTDHDVISGWSEADRAGREHGVVVVPGIEISCNHHRISVHLLAYLPDGQDQALMEELARSRDSRDTRLRAMVDLLAADGYPVTYEEVLAVAGPEATLGRPHIADVLVRNGVYPRRDDAFVDVLASGSPYYVAYHVLDPVRMTELVVAAGGVPVLAHPFASSRGRTIDEGLVEQMALAGLAGLEVDHRDHGPEERDRAATLAERLGLLRTGSSDYHGTGKLNRLGENTTAPVVLEEILARATGSGLLGAV
ncbi:PHP domain-containing protein [Ornithinimicrobium panacihumi]|uniref:PHP domain-containing protein n=1 Tax=Ornithinimicrobium panacihumi TaxID=2008449 RepID=UPI003F8BC82F